MNTKNAMPQHDGLKTFRAQADQLLVGALAVHLVLCLGVAGFVGGWAVALLVGVPAFVVPWLLSRTVAGELVTRIAVACSFMIFSALLIQQSRGMIEAHFGIFVFLALCVLYCDWRPLLAAAALIAAHHISFAWLQASGAGIYVFPQVDGSVTRVLTHAAYVVVEAGMLCYIAGILKGMVQDGVVVSEFSARVAEGRLDYPFDPTATHKRPLLAAIAQMQEELRRTLSRVRSTADSLQEQAGRLSNTSREIAADLDHQNSSTTSMAAAVEEMTVSIQQISDSASEARNLSAESSDAAHHGSTVIKAAVDEMAGIAEVIASAVERVEALGQESERAAEVVSIIKGIADQTNLLALNAAIEAARAGELGRGFAVVADEVRKLAERTTQATDEIGRMMKDMRSAKEAVLVCIDSAVARANNGVSHAAAAGDSIEQITARAGGVGNIVRNISDSLAEQNNAAQEISHHVERIAQMADRSSVATQKIAGEAETVTSNAHELRRALDRFHL